jgi:predicted nucleic acid-binding protein
MILLDTNIVSELFRPAPHAGVLSWLNAQANDVLYLCAPVLAELRYGMERLEAGRRKDSLRTAIERLESELYRDRILPFDVTCVGAYGRLVAARRRTGRTMQQMDAFIAAVAAANGTALATRNVEHFEGLGLELINPFQSTVGG